MRGDELVLGLRGEFRVADLHRDHRREPFADVVALERDLRLLQVPLVVRVAVDRPRDRGPESLQVRPAVDVLDRVREAVDVLAVSVVPLHRDLDLFAVLLLDDRDRIVVNRRLVLVQVPHERDDPALVVELVLLLGPLVEDPDANPGVQERQLAQPLRERLEIHVQDGKDRGVGLERDARPARLGRLFPLQRRLRNASPVTLAPGVAIPADLELESLRKEIHDRHPDPVQPPRDFVGVVVELPARVQLGHDDLRRGPVLFLVEVDRDPPAVVLDRHRVVRVDEHRHAVRVAGQRLVDRVVDDLVHHVVEAARVIRVADVHPGAFSHRIQAFEDLDVFRRVIRRHTLFFARAPRPTTARAR